jgi:16S rRNA (cytosine1402-N4)-methyltransferase
VDADRVYDYHVPVLLRECMEALAVKPDGVYVDATAGGGGHLRELIARLDINGKAVGIDRDPEAIAWCRTHLTTARQGAGPALILEQAPFSRLGDVLGSHGITAIDGLLLDLGISSHQIDDGPRGFSYMKDTPLDMRMDPAHGVSAAQFLSNATEQELKRVLSEYGEIRNPGRMARVFQRRRAAEGPMTTSRDMTACLTDEYGPNLPVKVIAKVFQALRIAVNDELAELSACLRQAISYVKKGGRIVVISYHSLEDRIVKNFFRDNENPCHCPPSMPYCTCGRKIMLKRLNKKGIVPGETEIRANPRSRSARLRCAEKVDTTEDGRR